MKYMDRVSWRNEYEQRQFGYFLAYSSAGGFVRVQRDDGIRIVLATSAITKES